MMFIHCAAALILLAAVVAPALANGDGSFRAQGNEPFWSLGLGEGEIIFRPMDGAEVRVKPIPQPRQDGGATVYEATSDGTGLTVTVSPVLCSDTMSGIPFPSTVTVVHGGKTFSGCGGEPASLLLGEWAVTELAGKPVIADSVPTLKFGDAGKISGKASCNRYFGGYTLSGEGLAVGELGSTKMLCEPKVMDQEQAFLAVLKATTGFAIGADGHLTLRSSDGRTIVARPLK